MMLKSDGNETTENVDSKDDETKALFKKRKAMDSKNKEHLKNTSNKIKVSETTHG